MRASTLLLATFVIWLLAKGRLGDYWALATTNAAGGAGSATVTDSGPGGGLPASTLPGFNLQEWWNKVTKPIESGGGGW